MKDFRAWIVSLFILVSMILAALAVMASAEGKNNSAKAMALYSPDTNSFLYASNADERLPMASTTKIMTALVTLENAPLDKCVTVPREAVGIEGSSLYLEEGDTLTVRDLLYSLMLRSANDAAVALAMEVGGDLFSFTEMMNARAEAMGLQNTSFKTPHGLDSDDHYTTARELCIIASEALKNEVFKEITSTYKYSFPLGEGTRTVVNHNKLLKAYDGTIGVKTGYTKKCGRCLVSAAEKNGVTLVAVTLDDPDDWTDHKRILDIGFSVLKSVRLSEVALTEFSLPAIGLSLDNIRASVNDESSFVVYNDDKINIEYDIRKYIASEIKEGDTVGAIHVYVNGELYKSYPVIAEDSAKKIKRKH